MSDRKNGIIRFKPPKRIIRHLSDVEKIGEEIIIDRQEIVALDRRRNQNRESMYALKTAECADAWTSFGPLLINLPKHKAHQVLEKDQSFVDVEINKLRSTLKTKANALQELEYKRPIPGLALKPLPKGVIATIKNALGIKA